MDRRNPILLALLLSFFVVVPAFPQGNSSDSPSPAVASQTAQSSAQTVSATPAQPTAKKVWTNDDLSDMRDGAVISNHAATTAKPSVTAPKPAANSKVKDVKWYRDQITKLQAQLPALESQISDLQAVLSGQIVDSTRKYGGIKPDDWSAQLAQLQQKRDDIFGKIAALEDEARHNGIPANSLP